MKDYVVFLSSGESICGTMEDPQAARLKKAFCGQMPGVQEFIDTEGFFLLEVKNIVALVLNHDLDKKEIGFSSTETP